MSAETVKERKCGACRIFGKEKKMNYKCEVIEDLLPLYFDNTCSKESAKAVEEHIINCESCKMIYAEIFLDSALCG